MEREQQPDDVFVWDCGWGYWDWCYRKDYTEDKRLPDDVLMTETPAWVHFMENGA